MSASRKILDRPLPSLAQWLGDGSRADGFEAWVKESTAMAAEAAAGNSPPPAGGAPGGGGDLVEAACAGGAE